MTAEVHPHPTDLAAPVTDDDGDRDCHLLDDEGRALCFANITGRRVHDGQDEEAYSISGDGFVPFCNGCHRPRCATCAEINRLLGQGQSA